MLTADQIRQVQQASALLRPEQRPGFERSIRNRLAGLRHPTDYDVHDALNGVLLLRGMSHPKETSP
jgi:hypothetical protein